MSAVKAHKDGNRILTEYTQSQTIIHHKDLLVSGTVLLVSYVQTRKRFAFLNSNDVRYYSVAENLS
jgi:hypothetical protein